MRKIFILGENHLENRLSEQSGEPGITTKKLKAIHSHKNNIGKDILIFGEGTGLKQYFIPEVKMRIPIPETPSIIEGLFQVLNFFLMMRKEAREKGLNNVKLNEPISKVLNAPFLKLNIIRTPQQVKDNAAELFGLVFSKLMDLILSLETETASIIREPLIRMEHNGEFTYDSIDTEKFSKLYKFSYRFVDDAIVSNVESFNDSRPQDTIFCIVVGEDHTKYIYSLLKSKNKYDVRYISESKGLEYIKTIGGRKNQKKRKTIRKILKKRKTIRKNKKNK